MVSPPAELLSVFLRGSVAEVASAGHFPDIPANFTLHTVDGREIVLDDTLSTTHTPFGRSYPVPAGTGAVAGLELRVDSLEVGPCYAGEGLCPSFTVTELQAIPTDAFCRDEITLDLGAPCAVAVVRVQIYCNAVRGLRLLSSVDGAHYQAAAELRFRPALLVAHFLFLFHARRWT